MLSPCVDNTDKELNRAKTARNLMEQQEGPTVARKDRIIQLRNRGEENHARTREFKLQRSIEQDGERADDLSPAC